MTIVRLIADDLTGALDTAAQFTGRIGPLPVLLDRMTAAPEASYALNLSCRDGNERTAAASTRDSLGCYSGADVAFKKIDSLLRGHWAAELAEIVKSGRFRRIVLAPAVPAQGRLTRDGLQMLSQPSGGRALIKDVATELGRHRVSSHGADGDVLLLDAESDAGLDAIVERYANESATLWCGAAGLARALAQESPRAARPLHQPHLVIVGSRHPVILRQVEVFRAVHPGWLAPMEPETSFIDRALTTLKDILMLRCFARSSAGSDRDGGGGTHRSRLRAALRPSSAAWRPYGGWRGDICRPMPRTESNPAERGRRISTRRSRLAHRIRPLLGNLLRLQVRRFW